MRRIALVLVFAIISMAFSGCCWNWNDPFHPRLCPVVHSCDGCGPCGTRPDHTRAYPYP